LYEATSGNSAGISLFGSLKNSKALVTPTLRDYAYTTAGADLLGKSHIISLHKISGTFKYDTKKYVGFIVKAKTTALNASLLDFLTVDLYKGGVKVGNSTTGSGVDVLNANILGYTDTHSYIDVTSSEEYDEVVLTYGNGATVADAFKIFSRTFNGGAWNSLILPVNLAMAQFKEAFGSDALLSEADNVTTTTEGNTVTTTLMFKSVTGETDGMYLKKNTPYIIWLSADEVNKHSAEELYESIEDGTVGGPIYTVESDVDFAYDDVTPLTAGTDFTFTGSYDSKQALQTGSYVFNKGNLYHTTKAHTQKAYRCWIEYTPTADTNNAPLNGFGIDDSTTGVTLVTDGNR